MYLNTVNSLAAKYLVTIHAFNIIIYIKKRKNWQSLNCIRKWLLFGNFYLYYFNLYIYGKYNKLQYK